MLNQVQIVYGGMILPLLVDGSVIVLRVEGEGSMRIGDETEVLVAPILRQKETREKGSNGVLGRVRIIPSATTSQGVLALGGESDCQIVRVEMRDGVDRIMMLTGDLGQEHGMMKPDDNLPFYTIVKILEAGNAEEGVDFGIGLFSGDYKDKDDLLDEWKMIVFGLPVGNMSTWTISKGVVVIVNLTKGAVKLDAGCWANVEDKSTIKWIDDPIFAPLVDSEIVSGVSE